MKSLRHIMNVCLFIFIGSTSFAQHTEDDIKGDAEKFFENEEYVTATPLYERLLALSPQNADYNFRYGTCLLYNSYQKKEAIRYLNFAVNSPTIDLRAFYFHGKALHLNYQFEDAKKSYKKYAEMRDKNDSRYQVDRAIVMCDNGKKLLATFTDIIVSEKQEIEISKFFRLYRNMETMRGDILVTADFQSKLDKKYGHVPVVYFPPNAKAIYYSSYGENEETGKDIYIRRRLPDGGWGDPQLLPGAVNSDEDEDFPYMHPSGDCLYFSSRGHNSMGGYDVFVSFYDPDNNAFGTPENVDFAISSPDDDLFYVVDSLNKNAYFASARQSQNGKLHVYKVRVAKIPIQEVIVMGDFLSEINPDNKRMDVTITSHANGAEIGKFISNDKGKYSFVFPKGGKYNYSIKVGNSDTEYKFVVDLPFLTEFRPLKQKAIHTTEGGQEIVKLVNLFNDKVEGGEALIAEVIRKRAELEVNIGNFDLKELDEQQLKNEALSKVGFENMTMQEISDQLEDLAINEKIKQETTALIESNINAEIIEKSAVIEDFNKKIDALTDQANNTTDPIAKHKILLEIQKQETFKSQVAIELETLNNLKKEAVATTGPKSNSGISKVEVIENQFNALVAGGKEEEAIDLLVKNKDVINFSRSESPDNIVKELVQKSLALSTQVDELHKKELEYEKIITNLNSKIFGLKEELPFAKKKEVEAIEKEIKDKENELKMAKELLESTRKTMETLNKQLSILDLNIESLQKAMLNDVTEEVNETQVAKSIAVIKEAISETEASTVEAQIEELIKNNPTINFSDEAVVTDFNNASSESIEQQNSIAEEKIKADNSLSEVEKTEKLINNTTSSLTKTENRLNTVDQKLQANPTDSELIEEKKKLEELKTKLVAETKTLETKKEALGETVAEVSVIEQLNEALKKSITADNSLTELEKINKLIQNNKTALNQIDKRLIEVEKQLQSNPNNPELKSEKKKLNELKAELIAENKQFEKQKEQLGETIADFAVIEQLNSATEQSIIADNSLTELEKTNKLIENNETAISQIEKRLIEVEKQLQTKPNNPTLTAEKKKLNELKAELIAENKQYEKQKEQLGETVADVAVIEQLNSATKQSIIADNSLSELEKTNKLIENNVTAISQIEKRLIEVEKQLQTNPNNPTLTAEKKKLNELKAELIAENKEFEKKKELLGETVADVAVIEQLNSATEQSIIADNSLTELEKTNKLIENNETAISQIERRLIEVEKQLQSNPNNPTLTAEKKKLNELKAELIAENREFEKNKELLGETVADVAVIEQLNSATEQSIIADNSLTELEKTNKLIENNETAISQIEKRLIEVEKQLQSNPNNPALKSEKKKLNELKAELIAENKQFEKQKKRLVETIADVAVIEQLNSATEQSIIADNSLTELEKANKLIENNETAISQIEKRLIEVEKQLQSNPNNPTLTAEKKKLNELKAELIAENREFEKQKEQLGETIADVAVIEQLNSATEQSIIADNSLTELEKTNKLIENNETAIKQIEKRLIEVEKQLQSNPNNPALTAEKKKLNELKAELIAENKELEKQKNLLNEATSDVAVTVEELINEVTPKYQTKKEEIENNSNLSEVEKLTQLQENDENLIDAINEELVKIDRELSKDPENQELLARKEILEQIKAQKQDEIAERSQTIDALNSASSVADPKQIENKLKEELQSEYAEKKREIDQSEAGEFEKNNRTWSVEVDYLNILLEKQEQIEKAEKRAPNDETIKAQATAIANLIEEQKRVIEEQKTKTTESLTPEIIATSVNSIDKNYATEIEEHKVSNSPTKGSNIAEREVILQEKLQAVIDQKEKELQRKYSVTIDLEKAIFEKALEESKSRESIARTGIAIVDANETNSAGKEVFIEQLREEAFGGGQNSVEDSFRTKEELIMQEQILAFYELQLDEKIEETTNKLEKDPTNNELKESLIWLKEEKATVANKRRSISVTIGEIETSVIAVNNNSSETDPVLNELKTQELELQSKLNNPEITSAEKKEVNAELKEVKIAQTERKNEVFEEIVSKGQQENESVEKTIDNRIEQGNPSEILTKVKTVNSNNSLEVEQLVNDANDAKTIEEKNFLLNQAKVKQEEMNTVVKAAVVDQERIDIEQRESVDLMTKEELVKRQRTFSVQIGEITTEIIRTEKEIESAKKKEIPALIAKKEQLIEEKSLVESQLREVEERLLKQYVSSPVVNESAMKEAISFNEERQVAGNEEYKTYYELATKALETEQQISTFEEELKNEQNTINELLTDNEEGKNDEVIQAAVQKVKVLQEDIARLRIELVQEKYAAYEALPENSEDAMKMQNLVTRGVKPIKATAVAIALLQMPVTGLAVDAEAESHYSTENPIPVDVESPSGLVYRVQIGAFAKPIPQDLFKEFNPVSGEKIAGTNITRYMAGFFNSSTKVTAAQDQIRNLGYSDAFIIAYCDGKRIGFGDARKMEAAGTCVPKGDNELMVEVAVKTAEKLGIPTTNEVQEVPELTYNQSPGAVQADPIELKKGLFFTVQVGVFNRPVGSESIFFMKELITIRLPNGQIRYSSGVFSSVEDALPRRDDALNKGVKGAFITAYYQGVRISLAEAKKLLAENGTSILQSEIEKVESVEVVKTPVNVIRTDTVSEVNVAPVSIENETDFIQIVTKKQFEEFPRDVLNRYNAEGNFFYDAKDKYVKSIVYKNVDDLPRLWNFKDDIDTVYIPFDKVDLGETKMLSVKMRDEVIPGDFMDWLLRFNYRREFVKTSEGLELRIFNVEPNEVEEVQREVRIFALEALVIDETELEIELDENR